MQLLCVDMYQGIGVPYEGMRTLMSLRSEGPVVYASADQASLNTKHKNKDLLTAETMIADNPAHPVSQCRFSQAANIITFAVNGSPGICILDGKRGPKNLDHAQRLHVDSRSYAQYNIFIAVSQKHSSSDDTTPADFPCTVARIPDDEKMCMDQR